MLLLMPPPNKNGDALVSPNQAWTESGTAVVTPVPPFTDTARTLDLVNRLPGAFTILRSQHQLGLVVIWRGQEPQTLTATLPLVASDASEVVVGDDWDDEWPDGFVIWFTNQ